MPPIKANISLFGRFPATASQQTGRTSAQKGKAGRFGELYVRVLYLYG
jgi:hypothetical protein